MAVCPNCEIWPVKAEDVFCSHCGTKLVSLSIPSEVLYFNIPREGALSELSQSLEFRNKSRADANVINSVKVSLDADKEALDYLEFTLDDQEVKFPLADLSIEPGESKRLKIRLDPEKLKGEDESYFKLSAKSTDPDLPTCDIDICISFDAPQFAFLSSKGGEEEVDFIDFGEVMVSSDPLGASKPVAREIQLKNKGGGILKLKELIILPGDLEGLEVKPGKESLRKGESTSLIFSLNPKLLPPETKDYELEATFSFEDLKDEKTIRISFGADSPPRLNLFLEGFKPDPQERNTLVVDLPKLRKKNYVFRLQNLGGGTCEIRRIETSVDWLRLYQGGRLKYEGEELRPDQSFCRRKKDYTSFHLMVDTFKMETGTVHAGEITIYSNAVNDPAVFKLKVNSIKRDLVEDYVGIDFGTTNSCVAIYQRALSKSEGSNVGQKAGARFKVVELEGEDTIPSRLFFREADDPVMGRLVVSWGVYADVSRSLRSLKRQIGSSMEREIAGRKFTPEELTEIIFRKLVNLLADELKGQPTKIIATCPANFDNAQRSTILRSLRRVVLRTLVEVYSEEVIQEINANLAYRIQGSESPWVTDLKELEEVSCCSDSERYRLPEDGFSLADVLANMLRFALRHRYELAGLPSSSREHANLVGLYKSLHKDLRQAYPFVKHDFDLENENRLLPLIDLLEQTVAEDVLGRLRLLDVKLLDEPSAAAYYYIYRNYKRKDFQERLASGANYILVYDFGGGTLDVSIARILSDAGGYRADIVATGGNNRLGGDDIDLAIVEAMLDQFQAQNDKFEEKDLVMCNSLDLRRRIRAKYNLAADELRGNYGKILHTKGILKDRAENLKISLSERKEEQEVDVPIETVRAESRLKFKLSNDEFDSLVRSFAKDSIGLAKGVLKQAGHNLPGERVELGQVILAGKTSKIPLIKKMMLEDEDLGWNKDIFYTEIEGQEKTCVALGAVHFGNRAQYGRTTVSIGARRLTHYFGYVAPDPLSGMPTFYSLPNLRLGAPYTDSKPLSGCKELTFDPGITEFYDIVQSKTDNPDVDENLDLVFIGKYLFTVMDQDIQPGETVSLRFSVDPNGILSVRGYFREEPVGRFSRYTVRKEEAKPYIFV